MSNNKMLIDAGHPEETRVVMLRGNRVDEFDFESEHKTQLRGNIYLAKVTRVEPSLQAAFVDYGGNRHGFLAFSEIHPDYYQIPVADRQALLEAEAEDARAAAEAEASEDAAEDIEAASEPAEKPARKRRARRSSKKQENDEVAAAPAVEAEDAAEGVGTTSESAEKPTRKRRTRRSKKKQDNEVVEATGSDEETIGSKDTSDDRDSESATTSAKPDNATIEVESREAAETEEDDNDSQQMSADNDGDDVLSEPAKPKRSRRKVRKKEPDSEIEAEIEDQPDGGESTEELAAEAVGDENASKPKPRRTSRPRAKKVDKTKATEAIETPSETTVKADSEQAAVQEKPKRTRKRATRKKEQVAESAEETQAAGIDAESNDLPVQAETDGVSVEKTPKTKSRTRSRRRKATDDVGDAVIDNENDDDEKVEALGSEDALEEVPTRRAPRRHYKIQEVIKRRQILLVQVVKEERGNKGAALTTYLSLAGRYSVLMPNTARGGGISRKITHAGDRKRLKSIASNLEVPQGMGVILRTAGASRQPEEIQRDFEYLMRLWENVRNLTLESTAPCLVYEEGSLIKRSIRDLYDKDTGEILVAGEAGYREAKDFMTMLMPDHSKNVKLYRDKVPMFARMGVETQLDAMLQPQVTLKSGGYMILDQTEALVAIDINSGRSTRQHSIEETAVQTNLEAADEIARQLRLRDLAGLIVIDFIDMEDKRNIRAVEKRLKDALKHDRARIQVGRISHFGLLEMSRQRIRASVLESTTQICPTCEGLGHVRATSSVVLAVLRAVEEQLNRSARNNLIVKVSTTTALYLLNNKRDNLGDLENRFGVSISIVTDETLGTTPCVIEKGEAARRNKAADASIQVDTVDIGTAAEPDAEIELDSTSVEPETASEPQGSDQKRRKRRRRRRGGNNGERVEASSEADQNNVPDEKEGEEKSDTDVIGKDSPQIDPGPDAGAADNGIAASDNVSMENYEEKSPRRTRRKRATKEPVANDTPPVESTAPDSPEDVVQIGQDETTRRRRRTTRRKKAESEQADEIEPTPDMTSAALADPGESVSTAAQPKKTGWWQRKFF